MTFTGKKLTLSLIVLLVACFLTSFLPVSKVEATVLPVYVSIDGYIQAYAPTYAAVHDKTTGQYLFTSTSEVFTGQYNISTSYYTIFRSFLTYDTGLIPDTANVTGAVLSVYVTDDESDTDFNVTVQNGQPTYPHEPLQTGDYYYDWYSGDGGSSNTSTIGGVGWWNITLSEDGLDWISKTGFTKLCLRSSNDIANVSSTGDEYIVFYSYESVGAYRPRLYVTYSVAEEDYYSYTFYGPYDEETGLTIDENVTVSVWSSEGAAYASFDFNTTYIYNVTTLVRNFQFTFSDNSTREYWVDPSESNSTTIYVFYGSTTSYAVNFMDTSGVLSDYPYVTAKRYVNGTLFTVEKRKADVYNTVLMNLIAGRTYTIYLGNEDVTYVFGELTLTATTSVSLVIRGVDFPKETLILQKYVRCYAYRNDSIFIVYEDTSEQTQNVSIQINYADLSTAYNTVLYAHSFSYEWTSADDETTYVVVVEVEHETYGTLTFKTILLADVAAATPPFDLAFLGEWDFDSSTLIPSIIILCVAGCFSALNAEVGALLMCITAIILVLLGWIAIPPGFLVAGVSLAILMALVYHKRRIGIAQ